MEHDAAFRTRHQLAAEIERKMVEKEAAKKASSECATRLDLMIPAVTATRVRRHWTAPRRLPPLHRHLASPPVLDELTPVFSHAPSSPAEQSSDDATSERVETVPSETTDSLFVDDASSSEETAFTVI